MSVFHTAFLITSYKSYVESKIYLFVYT